jgi:hypothetical protein
VDEYIRRRPYIEINGVDWVTVFEGLILCVYASTGHDKLCWSLSDIPGYLMNH